MRLADHVPALAALGSIDVAGLCTDSRLVRAGEVFFSLPSLRDSNPDAVARNGREAWTRGAVAVVSETPVVGGLNMVVRDVRLALAEAVRAFYSATFDQIRFLGVTGTNGKSTTTYVVEAIARAANEPIGLLGTIEQRVAERTWPATHTTLEALPLAQRLVEMQQLGAKVAVMEVSSHALLLRRADALRFSVAGFSNLTPDHLDLHGDMQRYGAAKARLFSELLAEDGVAVLNQDGAGFEVMEAAVPKTKRQLRVGRRDGADVRLLKAETSLSGLRLEVSSPLGRLALNSVLVGDYNIDNLLLGVGMAIAAGYSPTAIEKGVRDLPRVPGRLSRVDAADGRTGFVDYAHTEDALVRLLQALRPLSTGRLICVFGCGGDRDKTKRPLMGRAAATGAELIFATSDNPRTEDPNTILDHIEAGLGGVRKLTAAEADSATAKGYVREVDRARAIALAASVQRREDVLVVAGKGHENYQIIGTEKRSFDDLVELQNAYASTSVKNLKTVRGAAL